jgi:hypothetical protein
MKDLLGMLRKRSETIKKEDGTELSTGTIVRVVEMSQEDVHALPKGEHISRGAQYTITKIHKDGTCDLRFHGGLRHWSNEVVRHVPARFLVPETA